MESSANAVHREPWNKGKIVGQKAPFKLKDVDEVSLAEPSFGLAGGGHGLGDVGLHAGLLDVEDLRALVVAPVSDQADAPAPESLLRLAGSSGWTAIPMR